MQRGRAKERERQIQRVGKRQTERGNVRKREEYREWRKESETDRESGEGERDREREWRKESETDRLNGERERDQQRKWRKERERQRMRMRGDVVTV